MDELAKQSVANVVSKEKLKPLRMLRSQNKSHAVMSQRFESIASADDFPTPPWATRALVEHILEDKQSLKILHCLEPACGRGHMSQVLKSYFKTVRSSDAFDYNYGEIRDFLLNPYEEKSFDWVITNPPFRLAEEFVLNALKISRFGVAILVRTVFIESVGRYNALFNLHPPNKFAQFVERVPMVKGRLDQRASTATGYAWLIWDHNAKCDPRLVWVPPCRRKLERTTDYDSTFTLKK